MLNFLKSLFNFLFKRKSSDNQVEDKTSTSSNSESSTVKDTVKAVATFTIEEKDKIAELIKPIVKSFNMEWLEKFTKYMGDNIKTLKTYISLEEDDTVLSVKFTKSEDYNTLLTNFVLNEVLELVEKGIKNIWSDFKFDFSVSDGKIKIKKIG